MHDFKSQIPMTNFPMTNSPMPKPVCCWSLVIGKLVIGILSLGLLIPNTYAAADTPRLSSERVIMHTVAGDAVLVLYPDVAPLHVQQFLKLVRLGCYDGSHFFRIDPSFIQLADVEQQRHTDLTPEQQANIHPIKAEFSKTVKHLRGTLSMARLDDVNTAKTSFSVYLADSPFHDGKYTVFGAVEHGMEVFDYMIRVPRWPLPGTNAVQAIVPLEVTRMEVVEANQLPSLHLMRPHPVVIPPQLLAEYAAYANTKAEPASSPLAGYVQALTVGGLSLVVVVVLIGFYGQGKLPASWQPTLLLLILLVVGFLLLVLLTPLCPNQQWLAVLVFLAVMGLFRLMSQFESPISQ